MNKKDKIWKKLKIKVNNNTIDTKNHTMWAIISTSDKDRDGDIVLQNWDLENFKNNPVFVNSHKSTDATEVIGRVEELRKNNEGNLEGKFKFAVKENPKAEIIFKLYAGGFLNAVSAGFLPKEFGSNGEIRESELYEVSAVPVPANAMALAKSKGIDVEKLKKDKEVKEPEENVKDDKEEDDQDTNIDEKEPEIAPDDDESKSKADIDNENALLKELQEKIENINEELNELKKGKEEKGEENKIKTKENRKNIMIEAIENLSEQLKVETRSTSKGDRRENKRQINKAIRNLLEEKGRL